MLPGTQSPARKFCEIARLETIDLLGKVARFLMQLVNPILDGSDFFTDMLPSWLTVQVQPLILYDLFGCRKPPFSNDVSDAYGLGEGDGRQGRSMLTELKIISARAPSVHTVLHILL